MALGISQKDFRSEDGKGLHNKSSHYYYHFYIVVIIWIERGWLWSQDFTEIIIQGLEVTVILFLIWTHLLTSDDNQIPQRCKHQEWNGEHPEIRTEEKVCQSEGYLFSHVSSVFFSLHAGNLWNWTYLGIWVFYYKMYSMGIGDRLSNRSL